MTFAPLVSVVVTGRLTRSSASGVMPAALSAAPTVAPVVVRVRFLPAALTVTFLGVATDRARPSRPIGALRLVERSAPVVSRPRALIALPTFVAVVQSICGAPSTVTVTWRPYWTETRVPSCSSVVVDGATTSCGPTLMCCALSRSPTVWALVTTWPAWPSTARVTSDRRPA